MENILVICIIIMIVILAYNIKQKMNQDEKDD